MSILKYIKVKTKGQIEGENLAVPKLRFKEFKNDYIKYMIGDTLKVKSGRDQKLVECINGKYPILGTGGKIGSTNNFLCNKPSVLIGRKGTIDKPQYMDTPFWTVDTLFYTDINDNFNEKYIFYAFQNINWKKYDESTGVPSLSCKTIENITYYIPNKNEQEKIANFLSLLDKKIELQQQKIEALKICKKGLLHNLKSNSQNWTEYKVQNLFDITRGQVIPKANLKDSPTDDYIYPVYSSQTSNYGILGYDNTYDFDGKFLTWTTDGANAGKVFYRNGKFRCTNVCGLLHSNKNNDYINLLTADLLNYETPKYVSYVGNPKLMNNVMADIKIKLPSLEVQNKISHIFSIFDNKLFIEEQKLNNLNNTKKSLLQQMFI